MSKYDQSCDPHLHQLAIRLARECRHVIQAVLRDEEKGEADRCFYEIIRVGLQDFQKGKSNEIVFIDEPDPSAVSRPCR